MASRRWRLSAVVLLLAWTGLAVAQEGTARLEGRVIKDGEGVGAVVVLINELKLSEVTDSDGKFVFTKVPPGSYTLIFTLGDNNLTRQMIATGGRTMQLDVEVDWDLGVSERMTVTAAARAAKIVDAPAAVTEITEEKIEQQASTGQVPKILEFTPGAEVTQSGLYDFNFNTRGFNSSLNRRVSTYIDGRDVGVVLLGAQEWSAISSGLDDLASLEFIRGPSAALYGANASSGVINITTKAPRDSEGIFLRLTAGELDTQRVDFRWAGELGSGWYAKVLGGGSNTGDFTVSRDPDVVPEPEYSEFCELVGETDCLPEERTLFREQDNEIRFGSVRFDKYLANSELLTFEVGTSDIKGPVFQTGIGRVQNLGSKRPFFRFNFSNGDWNLLAHYTQREGNQINLTKALLTDFDLITDTERYGVEGQWNRNFSGDKLRLVVGAAHTEERVDTANAGGVQTVVYEPIKTDRQAVFSQVDWRVSQKIKLVFAGRVDANTLHATQFSPKAAMVYSANPKNSVRFTYNEAFQVANYSEFFLHAKIASFPIGGFARTFCNSPILPQPVDCGIDENFIPILAVGNNDLELEETRAWEIGYSGLLANRVFITLDYYNANNQNFITDLVPQVGTILGNVDGCVDVNGNPETDPTNCPINNDYLPWVSTDEAENTILVPSPPAPPPGITVAQGLRNAVEASVGGERLGFRLAQDLDGSTVVVGRTYTNVGEVDTQGVDLGVQYFISEPLSLQVSYSWFDFEIIDADDEVGDILLPNSPANKVSLAVSYTTNRWSASFGARWVEGFRWVAGVFQGEVPDYTTADLSASYRFNDTIQVGFNVGNVADNVHRQTFGGDLLNRRAVTYLTFSW